MKNEYTYVKPNDFDELKIIHTYLTAIGYTSSFTFGDYINFFFNVEGAIVVQNDRNYFSWEMCWAFTHIANVTPSELDLDQRLILASLGHCPYE